MVDYFGTMIASYSLLLMSEPVNLLPGSCPYLELLFYLGPLELTLFEALLFLLANPEFLLP